MKKNNDDWKTWVLTIIILIIMTIGAIALVVVVEYGRYLFLAPDDMDFSTFYWIDTLRR